MHLAARILRQLAGGGAGVDDDWSKAEWDGDYYPACGSDPDEFPAYRLPSAHDQSLCAVASAWLAVPFLLWAIPYFGIQPFNYSYVPYSKYMTTGPLCVWWALASSIQSPVHWSLWHPCCYPTAAVDIFIAMTWGLVVALDTIQLCRQMVKERGFAKCKSKMVLHIFILLLLLVDSYLDFILTETDGHNGLIYHLGLRFLGVVSSVGVLGLPVAGEVTPNKGDEKIWVATSQQQQMSAFMCVMFFIAYTIHMVVQSAWYETQPRSCVDYPVTFGQPSLGFKIGTILLAYFAIVPLFLLGTRFLIRTIWKSQAIGAAALEINTSVG